MTEEPKDFTASDIVGSVADSIRNENKEPETNYTDILQECAAIGKERMQAYDNPMKSMQIACNILSTTFNIKLSVEQMSLVLVALKMSRQFKSFKEDNILDSINYLAIALDAKRRGL